MSRERSVSLLDFLRRNTKVPLFTSLDLFPYLSLLLPLPTRRRLTVNFQQLTVNSRIRHSVSCTSLSFVSSRVKAESEIE